VKLAFVIHRYGAAIAGGSETHCRQLAERLNGRHDITVLTTCAHDYVTWANALPPGPATENGVRVHRFPVARPRDIGAFVDISEAVFHDRGASPDREDGWFLANGPDSPELLEHVRAHQAEYDLVLFWAYRYAPSYFGVPLAGDHAVLVPTAEEDPAIDLDVLERFFARPAGWIFLTPEEQALVSARAGRRLEPSCIAGIGIEPVAPHHDRSALDRLGIPGDYVLYLGRVDVNKGCATLLNDFRQYADAGGSATLVLAGPAAFAVPAHRKTRALGYVDGDLRDALLTHARALIVPSPFESLSIVLLEAWNHGIPALVNGTCRVLDGQVRRANGGLAYRSSGEFQEAMTWLLSNDDERRQLGRQGLAYVEREYRWPTVIDRVERLLATVSTSGDGAGRGSAAGS
jgi:glycosyltransferase involved in cell wall biosynthesis